MVLVPIVIVTAGYLLEALIPGCVMGGANGAHNCGILNPLLTFVGGWGMIYLALGMGTFIVVILPAWIIGVTWKDLKK